MFGKIFSKMYEGSMMGKGADVFALWPYIIANADMDGFLEINPKLVAVKIGMTVEAVEDVLHFFLQPDPTSRRKELEGRKLERVGEYLYRVVNHEYYRNLKNLEARREQNRLAAARSRAKKKGVVLPKSTPLSGEIAAVKGQNNGTLDENFEPVKPYVTDSGTVNRNELPQGDSGVKISRAFD